MENWRKKFDELFYQNEKGVWMSRSGESYGSESPEMLRGELFRFIQKQIDMAVKEEADAQYMSNQIQNAKTH